jgi:multiple sugar transport system permease protein
MSVQAQDLGASVAAGAAAPRARRRRAFRAEGRAAFWFLLPSLLGFLAFLLFPLVASLALSFTNWQLLNQPNFLGLANYIRLFTVDPSFWRALLNTVFYTVEYLVLNIALALGMAVWISSLRWGKRFFRLIFFLPTFTPMIGASLVWVLIFTPGGLMDWVVQSLGLPIPNFRVDPAWAMQAISSSRCGRASATTCCCSARRWNRSRRPISMPPRSTAPPPGSASGRSRCR